MNFPKGILYSAEYLWIKAKKDVAIIGVIGNISDKVKEFAYINLPKKGDKIKKGETLISLETVKWAKDIVSPLSGEVIETNLEAYNKPSLINSKPFSTWILKMKIINESELKGLMSSQKALKYYSEYLKNKVSNQ